MRKTVFLDRDGVINRKAPEDHYITDWKDFQFLPGVPEAIHALNGAGYLVLVVTNQRGVARGMMTMEAVEEIHRRMCRALEEKGARIDGVYVCPHEIGQCDCRKPQIGLFLQAERDYPIDRASSWAVGDSPSDVEAGRRYGVRTILTKSLPEAAERILESDAARTASSGPAQPPAAQTAPPGDAQPPVAQTASSGDAQPPAAQTASSGPAQPPAARGIYHE